MTISKANLCRLTLAVFLTKRPSSGSHEPAPRTTHSNCRNYSTYSFCQSQCSSPGVLYVGHADVYVPHVRLLVFETATFILSSRVRVISWTLNCDTISHNSPWAFVYWHICVHVCVLFYFSEFPIWYTKCNRVESRGLQVTQIKGWEQRALINHKYFYFQQGEGWELGQWNGRQNKNNQANKSKSINRNRNAETLGP